MSTEAIGQKRNQRAAQVVDRWFTKRRDSNGKRIPSAYNGKGKRWHVRYVDPDGHEQFGGSFATKPDAEAKVAEINTAMTTGNYVTPQAGKVSVETVYTGWAKAQGHISAKTEGTRKSVWICHVRDQWGQRNVVDLKTSEIRLWVAGLAADEAIGTTTIENAFGLLRQVLGAAVEDRRLPRNPCDGVKLPKREHADRGYLSHVQVAALTEAVERNPEVVRFLAYTGLRWGEMAALRVQDFDMLRRRVNISRSVTEAKGLTWSTPKTHERRSVPFPKSLSVELSALMVGKSRDDLVFTDSRGSVLRVSNYRSRVFATAVKMCQTRDETFPTITPHDLRHTAASLAVSAGANVKAVQRMLGHAKASMTLDTYADLFDDDLEAVADALDIAIGNVADAGSKRNQSVSTAEPLRNA
ncbi:site-specific recombinase XerD [Williamsia limnetica]|uniref:Site-specific recombinase XerD n=1 Tax=Williamsia limnetica TaxID=882452 RepID=A0A318RNV2_WILLI|nr:site-specific integrase [Williamsia limnetica]PYE19261.1 site-specific recombinase XerD [Williamsia limnetica]